MTEQTPTARLVEWARDNMAFPIGNPGGEGRGHIDENARFKLRDMVGAIDATAPTADDIPEGKATRLLSAMLAAQMAGPPYKGWNITALNKAADEARACVGDPSIRDLNPDIAKMQDHFTASQPVENCSYCDGTGDVHRADGEWLGPCPEGHKAPASQPVADVERAKLIAAYKGPIVSFDFRAPFYLASCDACGWVGSSELCGTDEDNDVFCPRCYASGADCGKVANDLVPAAQVATLTARMEALEGVLRDMVDLYDTDEGTRSLAQVIAARAALASDPANDGGE